MEIIRLNAAHGAEIRGVNLSESLSPEIVASIRQAWHANPVLLFREQNLDDPQLMTFAGYF